jgi:hypothetical protein
VSPVNEHAVSRLEATTELRPNAVDLGDRTSRLPKVKLGEVPTPILARAEQLCDLVDDADGIRPDRGDLVSALILSAVADGQKLAAAWQAYRVAPVHKVLLNASGTSGLMDLASFKKR